MTLNQFKDYMVAKNFKVIDKNAFGIENEFPVLVTYKGTKNVRIAFAAEISSISDVKKSLKASPSPQI